MLVLSGKKVREPLGVGLTRIYGKGTGQLQVQSETPSEKRGLEGRRTLTELHREAGKTQVVMLVGGEGKRLGISTPKALVKLNGTTLLARAIELFLDAGFEDFILLTAFGDQAVRDYVKEHRWKGARIRMFSDAKKGMARGKAVADALRSGGIDSRRRSIMVYPDDIFLDYTLPMQAILEHLYAVKAFKTVASMVVARGHRSPYGVARADEHNVVTGFEEKPVVPWLTSVGFYIFEPGVYSYFKRAVGTKAKGPVEFERVVLPAIVKDRKAYAIMMPLDSWIPVNTIKELEQAQAMATSGVLSPK